ncbi:hypothetical protein FACS189420_5980 [Bacteroidia bacterium]|nr:hypothetical protein FACS189420_5980 [Bacteroidia bacterium]
MIMSKISCNILIVGKEDAPEDVKAILKDLQNDDNPIIAIAKLK